MKEENNEQLIICAVPDAGRDSTDWAWKTWQMQHDAVDAG